MTLLAGIGAGLLLLGLLYLYVERDLPRAEALREVRLQVPLRVYSRDGVLLGEFGELRRSPVKLADVPRPLVQAFLAAEDDRFYEHPGVDWKGIARAGFELLRTGEKRQGGSTITMQVARNFFLSREKTFMRKISEIFLAFRIESELSKDEILELYLNKIYLGNRAYGVASAAQIYYGTTLDRLTLSQMAMIAGLPKAPSRFNPVVNRSRALLRRDHILGRMRELGFIDEEAHRLAVAEADQSRIHAQVIDVEAAYIAEMVRAEMVARHGDAAYTEGFQVITTVEGPIQAAANEALRNSLLEHDRRAGYRGPERHVELPAFGDADAWETLLQDVEPVGNLLPALVVSVAPEGAEVYVREAGLAALPWEGVRWAAPNAETAGDGAAPATETVLQPGAIVFLRRDLGSGWALAQVPRVEGAFVAIAPDTGAVRALVGGFDFWRNKYNRAIQSQRQPGSAFKPFIYSAALERGYSTATIVNDAPVVFEDAQLDTAWRPQNYSGVFYGPTRLREALAHSRNLASIRLLQGIGVDYAREYVTRFGFEASKLPKDLSLALGNTAVSPLELTAAFAVFANGGYRVRSYFIDRVLDAQGTILWQAQPAIVCPSCPDGPTDGVAIHAPRVLDARNAYLVHSMMTDVIRVGTARRALRLGRKDLAGKTGTTNEQRDAWFCGYNRTIVATAWVGFDDGQPLGEGETGGRLALPVWVDFMAKALAGTPDQPPAQPPGIVTVRIDPETGLLAAPGQSSAVFEMFRETEIPERGATQATAGGGGRQRDPEVERPLF